MKSPFTIANMIENALEKKQIQEHDEKPPEPYRDYGWENGWKEVPQAVRICRKREHYLLKDGSFTNVDIGPPMRGMHHVMTCHICRIKFHYDSSD